MPNGTTPISKRTNGNGNGNGNGNRKTSIPSIWPTWSHNRLFFILTTFIMLGIIAWQVVSVGTVMRNYKFIGKSMDVRNTITIEGQGKVRGIPDIATVNLGFSVEKKEVREAQKENATTMNKLIAALQKIGIKSEDMQTTDYSIYPQYDYLKDGGQKLRGYMVSQTVTVKIRNLANVSTVLDQAGALGLNQVGGIQFTMDEPETLRQQARVQAMMNAKVKAGELAKIAGVRLGRVVSFSENVSGGPMPMYARAYGEGASGAAPDVQPGSENIVVNATVTYEIE